MNKRECKGLWIPIEIYLDERLSSQDVFLIAEIDSLDNGEGCFARNEHFCKRMKIKERAVQNHLKELEKLGLIEIVLNRKNNTRRIFSNVKEIVYEQEKTKRNKLRELTQKNAQAGAKNCVSTYIENTKENTTLEKNTKKENSKDQIVEHNEMVETTSTKSSECEKEFESTWKYCFMEYRKFQRPLGSKSEAKGRFEKQIKKYGLETVKQAIYNYTQDCIEREFGFKHLSSFLALTKKYVEEWKNESENHKAFLELKQTPQNTLKNARGFENKLEREERLVKENREQINRVLSDSEEEVDLPWLSKTNNSKMLN